MNPSSPHSRRGFLSASGRIGAAAALVQLPRVASANETGAYPQEPLPPSLQYCLNTSTINGSKVPIRKQLKLAADTGYDSVELWVRDIQKFLGDGGTLPDLAAEIEDLGLKVASAIAFGNWIVDEDAKRKAGLERCKADMEIVRAIGGQRIAAPPAGATNGPPLDLSAAAERYHELLEVGRSVGVQPQLELWGFSRNVSTLEEVLYIASGAEHPDACILLDIYHMYKGGSDFHNLGWIPAAKMHCLHMNDYPATPNRQEIADKDRVYPGDGVAPIDDFLRTIVRGGFRGTLSLELFNRTYWQQPAEQVARTGLEKMKRCVERALG